MRHDIQETQTRRGQMSGWVFSFLNPPWCLFRILTTPAHLHLPPPSRISTSVAHLHLRRASPNPSRLANSATHAQFPRCTLPACTLSPLPNITPDLTPSCVRHARIMILKVFPSLRVLHPHLHVQPHWQLRCTVPPMRMTLY